MALNVAKVAVINWLHSVHIHFDCIVAIDAAEIQCRSINSSIFRTKLNGEQQLDKKNCAQQQMTIAMQ